MKNFKFLCLATLILFFIFSCGKEKSSDIVGTWKISEVSSSNEIPADLKADVEESLKEMKESYLLVIKPDSTFEHTISGSTSKGRWNLSPDSKKLTLTYEDGKTEVSNIAELTSTKMVTSVEINDAKNTISFEKQAEK
jgi:hypothetical protein